MYNITRTQDAKLVSQLLSEKASEMQTVILYKTIKRASTSREVYVA